MKPIILLFVLLLIQSPASPQKTLFPREENVKTEVIVSDLHIRMPYMTCITDSLLIVQGVRAQEKYLKYYHLDRNELISEFGQTGKGPGQLITPYLFHVDPVSSNVYIYDPNIFKMHVFDIAQCSAKPDTIFDIAIKDAGNRDRLFFYNSTRRKYYLWAGLTAWRLSCCREYQNRSIDKLFWEVSIENEQFKQS